MTLAPSPRSVRATYRRLIAAHPDATCALPHASPFELLVAVVLSAQTTDAAVSRVMGPLTSRWPDARSLSGAGRDELESVLRPIGMYRTKARNVIALSAALLRDFGGEVPRTSAELSTLPGVGRKTANVVLGAAWGIAEGIAVDTHVLRVAQRLGWSEHDTAERVERDLMRLLPRDEWVRCSHVLIFHGRRICGARAPACGDCPVTKRCPSAFRAETVGRKWRRPRVSGST